ncbi:MAG: FtsQ-type POTRA domain-containing protein [Candidatus Wildermuthbacteria bacterium]|nr:FtsQ-type POTRA domain-containing protein [Candidatus Wildermuthbacteria bacterium]
MKKLLKSKVFWVGILGFFVLAGSTYGIFFTPFFQIKYIEIRGNENIAEEKLRQATSESLQRKVAFFATNNFFLANAAVAAAKIRAVFPEIELVAVQKKFPDKVRVTVQERQGIATWCQNKILRVELEGLQEQTTRSIRQCFALDKQGVIFEEMESGKEVILSAEGVEAALGDQVVDPVALERMLQFQKSVDAFPLFEQVGLRVLSLLIVSKERVNAGISEGWEMYFNPSERIDWQIQKVKLVLEQEISSQRRPFLEYIDLRFLDQAYIKYRQ